MHCAAENFVYIASGSACTIFGQLVCDGVVSSADVPEFDLASMSTLSILDLCIQLAE